MSGRGEAAANPSRITQLKENRWYCPLNLDDRLGEVAGTVHVHPEFQRQIAPNLTDSGAWVLRAMAKVPNLPRKHGEDTHASGNFS